MDDSELLTNFIKNGREDAFGEIVQRYLGKVYNIAYRRTGDRSLAEEITQDVFAALARKASKLVEVENLPGWLHRATTLESAQALRKKSRRRARMEAYVAEGEVNLVLDSPSSDADIHRFLDEAVSSLDPADRKAVLLRFFEDLTFRQIGDRLGQSTSSAERRVSSALEKLSRSLKHRGVTASASLLGATLASETARACPVTLLASSVARSALEQKLGFGQVITFLTKAQLTLWIGAGSLIVITTLGGVYLGAFSVQTHEVADRKAKTIRTPQLTALVTSEQASARSATADKRIRKILARLLELTKHRMDPTTVADIEALRLQIQPEDMDIAFARLDRVTNPSQRFRFGMPIFNQLAEQDGAEAARRIPLHSRMHEKNIFSKEVVRTWAQHDHKEAFAWHQSQQLARNVEAGKCLSREAQRLLLAHIFSNWLKSDRETAITSYFDLPLADQKAAAVGFKWEGENVTELLLNRSQER